MTYFVYEDGPTNIATIHLADCPWCKHGQGLVRDALNEKSKWWGEFVTFDKAAFAAHNTGKPHRLCKKCNPS